ncbi:MAG: hypothetical protein ACJ704_16035 [Nitrososphaeraceae archaeon]
MKREGFKLFKRHGYYIEYRKHVNGFKTKIVSVSITNKNTILEWRQKNNLPMSWTDLRKVLLKK